MTGTYDVISSWATGWITGIVVSVAVAVLAILWAVKSKYNTAKWRGAGCRVFWFSLLFILPTVGVEMLGERLVLYFANRTDSSVLSALLSLLYYTVFVGLFEEGGKYLAIYTGTGGYRRMTSATDIVNYALISAAAFTGLENIIYFIRFEGQISTAIIRNLVASPLHITCTLLIALGRLRAMETGDSKRFFLGIITAVTIHGCYDFLAADVSQTSQNWISGMFLLFMVVGMAMVVVGLLRAPRRIASVNSRSTCKVCRVALPGLQKTCPGCGGTAFYVEMFFPAVKLREKPQQATVPPQAPMIPMQAMQPIVPPVQAAEPMTQPPVSEQQAEASAAQTEVLPTE